MQLLDHAGRIGVARLVEFVAAPLARQPVLPVLDDGVERHLHLTVFRRDAEQFVLRRIVFLRLPQAPRPARHHGRRAGQAAVALDHVVEFRAVHEVVIDAAARLRADQDRGARRQAGFHFRDGRVVPQDAEALGRHEHRHGHVAVRLLQARDGAAVIEQAVLVLAQAVQDRLGVEALLDAVGDVAAAFLQDVLAVGRLERDGAAGARHAHLQVRRRQRVRVGRFADLECDLLRLRDDGGVVIARVARRAEAHVHHARRHRFDGQDPFVRAHLHAGAHALHRQRGRMARQRPDGRPRNE